MMREEVANFNDLRSQKGISFNGGDYYGKICTSNAATFVSHEDSNCMDKSQSSTKQRNDVLSCLDPNNKCRLSERDFVEDVVSSENELRRSGRVRTRRKIYNAKSGTFKLILIVVYINGFN